MALVACVTYLAMGARQRERAVDAQRQIARARGHTAVRAAVFPGFANQLVWRSLYDAGGRLYLDRIRVPWMGDTTWSPGTSAGPFGRLGGADGGMSQRLRRDFKRFQWFADGWVARSAADPSVIGDARYSLSPDRFEPVWGIRFTPGLEPPVQWVDHSRGRRVDLRVWSDEVRGTDPAFRALLPEAERTH
jgi:inner membrane protein